MNEVVLSYKAGALRNMAFLSIFVTLLFYGIAYFLIRYGLDEWQSVLIGISAVILSVFMTFGTIALFQRLFSSDAFFVRINSTGLFFPGYFLKKNVFIDWKEVISISYDKLIGQLTVTYQKGNTAKQQRMYITENTMFENPDFLQLFECASAYLVQAQPMVKSSNQDGIYSTGSDVNQAASAGKKDRNAYNYVVIFGVIALGILTILFSRPDQKKSTESSMPSPVAPTTQPDQMEEEQEEPQFVSIRQKTDSGEDKEVLRLPIESSISVWNNKLFYSLGVDSSDSVEREFPVLMSYDFSKDPASQPEVVLDTSTINAKKPDQSNSYAWDINTQILKDTLAIKLDGLKGHSYTYLKDLKNDSPIEYLSDSYIDFHKTDQGYIAASRNNFNKSERELIDSLYSFDLSQKKLKLLLDGISNSTDGYDFPGIDSEHNFYVAYRVFVTRTNDPGPYNRDVYYKNLATFHQSNPDKKRMLITEEKMPKNISGIQYNLDREKPVINLTTKDYKMFTYDISSDTLAESSYEHDGGYHLLFGNVEVDEPVVETVTDFVPPEGFSVEQL